MTFDDYRSFDALGLAALVRKREVSRAEVMQAALERLRAVNPTINAVPYLHQPALAPNAPVLGADGPFAGVPYCIKDLHAPVRDMPLAHGRRLFAGGRAAGRAFRRRRTIAGTGGADRVGRAVVRPGAGVVIIAGPATPGRWAKSGYGAGRDARPRGAHRKTAILPAPRCSGRRPPYVEVHLLRRRRAILPTGTGPGAARDPARL